MNSEEKVCPDCAETVKAAARKCKHCGYEFAPLPAGDGRTATTNQTFEPQLPTIRALSSGLSPNEVPDLLTQLTDRSLIAFDGLTGRYYLLETVRQYARDRLLESGEGEEWRNHHLAFYLAMAKEAERALRGPEQRIWIERIEAEYDNLRVALGWCRADHRYAEAGLQLCDALYRFWNIRSMLTEGREWLEVMLGQNDEAAPSLLRARGLNWLAVLAWRQGQRDEILRPWLEESVTIARELGADSSLAESLNSLADLHARQNELDAARTLYEEAIALNVSAGAIGNTVWPYLGLARLAGVAGDQSALRANLEQSVAAAEVAGDTFALNAALDALADFHLRHRAFEAARACVERSLAQAQGLGDRVSLALRFETLAELALAGGKISEARSIGERGLWLVRQTEDRSSTGWALLRLAHIACHQRDWHSVRALTTEAAVLFRALRHEVGMIRMLEYMGAAAAAEGELDVAARLWAAYESLLTDPIRSWSPRRAPTLADATAETQGKSFERARREGAAMSLAQAVEYALSSPPVSGECE